VITLWALSGKRCATHGVVDLLGDVGCMITDTLDAFGAKKKIDANADVADILHHVREEFAEYRVVHCVDILVFVPYGKRFLDIALCQSFEHVPELRLHQFAHQCDKQRGGRAIQGARYVQLSELVGCRYGYAQLSRRLKNSLFFRNKPSTPWRLA
jgi:hypothetical protein